MSLIVSGLWAAGYAGSDVSVVLSNIIIAPVGIMAAATAGISLCLYYFEKTNQKAHWFSFVSYTLMIATTAGLIVTTGNTGSPFVALWMLLSIFSGLYRLLGIGLIAASDISYITYQVTIGHAELSHTTIFVLAFVIPLVVSILIWRYRDNTETNNTKAYSALARELSQVANKSEIVINAIADGVIAIDAHGTIQLINPAAQSIMGWGKEDALELDYHSVIKLSDSKDKLLTDQDDPIQQVLRSGTSITRNDLSMATSTGKKMIISLLVSPVGQGGSGAIIVFRDITGDVAENRHKAEFISTASHEMRTPVAAIEGYIGLALNPATATIDDKARVFLTKAHESAQHLGDLFQDLLDVSKAEDGRLGNNPSAIDVTSFVRDVVNGLLSTAYSKEVSLSFLPDASTTGSNATIHPAYFIYSDPSHFREILSNLIENSIKYTKKGGKISVDISGDEAHVTISVVDNGIGIPKEDIPHLFQKFYRVDNTDTREIGGTGLGLYLCRRMTEAMDGRIWVESDYGKGSMFFVELPRVSSDAALATQPTLVATAPAATSTGNTPDQNPPKA